MADAFAHPATVSDVDELLLVGLRAHDLDEVRAAFGDIDLRSLLVEGVAASFEPGVLRAPDHRLCCLFGATPHGSTLSDIGLLWALSTDEMARHPLASTATTKRYIEYVRRHRFPRLMNWVDARNTPSIRWLRRLGFTIDPPEAYGIEQRPFHRFHMGF